VIGSSCASEVLRQDTQDEEPTAETGGSPFVRTLYLLEPGVLIVPVKVPEYES